MDGKCGCGRDQNRCVKGDLERCPALDDDPDDDGDTMGCPRCGGSGMLDDVMECDECYGEGRLSL